MGKKTTKRDVVLKFLPPKGSVNVNSMVMILVFYQVYVTLGLAPCSVQLVTAWFDSEYICKAAMPTFSNTLCK